MSFLLCLDRVIRIDKDEDSGMIALALKKDTG